MPRFLSCVAVSLMVAGGSSSAASRTGPSQPKYSVEVAADGSERRDVITSFVLPNPPPNRIKAWRLTDPTGRVLAVDVEPDGRGTFLLPYLPAQSVVDLLLEPADPRHPGPQAVEVEKKGTKLQLSSGGAPMLEYQTEPGELPRRDIKPIYRRGGYLHPLITPAGKMITDDFATNHIHHHGLWMAWTKTEFEGRKPDFWNMGDGTGTIEFKDLTPGWSGHVSGGFRARHQFVDLSAKPRKVVLNEEWELRAYARGTHKFFTFDLVSTQRCAGSAPLRLPKYYYGGIGFRGNAAWNGTNQTQFLTAEGETNRVKGNETRAHWCYIGGQVEGQAAGIALLCHPDNFRAPQPMRLHPTEPFFCFAPSQGGDWAITPEQPYIARYRALLIDGAPDASEINAAWEDYAHPPKTSCRQLP